MNTAINPPNFQRKVLLALNYPMRAMMWALLVSIVAHLVLLFMIPAIKFDAPKLPEVLKVVLELPKPAETKPVVNPEPEPPKPEQIKPKIEPKLPPKVEPVKPKEVTKPAIEPIEPTKNMESLPAPVNAPIAPPSVMAVQKSTETQSEFTAPVTKNTESTQEISREDFEGARTAYLQSILGELRRNIKYPKIAEKRGTQGVTKVEVTINDEGDLVSVQVVESSGSDMLDEGAIATVKRSNLKQYMKAVLKGKLDKFIVPVAFKMKDA